MENEKVTRIKEFLARHGASIDTISKQKLAQFEKVDEIESNTAQQESLEMTRLATINIKPIAIAA